MNKEFWIKKWQTGETRFHQKKFHSALEMYGERFQDSSILVPLCGKSLDMLYLASHGHDVIGVELSPIACRDYFIENGLIHTEKTVGNFVIYESENIQIWCGDFFDLPQQIWNKITGIYDRAALVALPIDIRQKYAHEMVNRTTRQVDVLLLSFEYPDGVMQGPPFSVTEKEIHSIYKGFEIEQLQRVKEDKYQDHPTLSLVDLFETVYWLKK